MATKILTINLRHYRRLAIDDFHFAFSVLIFSLTDNSNFISPEPGLEAMRNNLRQFSALAAAVKAKNLALKPDRDLLRSKMLVQLNLLATYCIQTAISTSTSMEQAITKIETTAFVIGRRGGVRMPKPLPAPQRLYGRIRSEAVEIKWSAVKNARYYILRKTNGMLRHDSVWTEIGVTKTRYTITNLKPGQIVTCQVVACNSYGDR